jgi:hypothetical protein
MKKLMIAAAILCAAAGCKPQASDNGSRSSDSSVSAAPTDQLPGSKRFVNDPKNNFSAKMKEKYVDFSFSYPEGWREKISPEAGNFVQVYAPEVDGLEPFSLALGNASGSGNAATDKVLMESLLPQFEQQFGSSIQDFEVTGRGERQLGRYNAHGFSFTGKAPGPAGKPVDLVGRIDVIVPPGQQRGVTAISLAYDRGSGAPSPDALGQMEPFRTIYGSLSVGSDSP